MLYSKYDLKNSEENLALINDLITEQSWFIKKLKQNALFYTIEVYKNNPKVLLQQYKLVKNILKSGFLNLPYTQIMF